MFMKQYIQFNITKKSNTTIEYVLKMGANIMEAIIFMFMGLNTVSDNLSWNTGFVLVTVVCCTLYRFLGCFLFGFVANRARLMKLKTSEIIIMSYGGFRGAIAFALAHIIDEDYVPRKREIVTAAICVIYFTVFFQVFIRFFAVFLLIYLNLFVL